MVIYRGYKYRLYPTEPQIIQLKTLFKAVRVTYNTFLTICKKAYCETNRFPDESYMRSCIPLLVRKEPWLENVDRTLIEKTISHLAAACHKYQKDPKAGMPKRKNVHQNYQSFTILWRPGVNHLKRKSITVAGIDNIKVKLHRVPSAGSKILSVTVSMTSDSRYYVSILFKLYKPDAAPPSIHRSSEVVGLDFSMSSFFVASDPELKPDQDYLRRYKAGKKEIQYQNQRLSRCKYGGKNYAKRKKKYVRVCEHIENQRKDYLNKLSTKIADHYDIVCIETLSMQEMILQNPEYARAIEDHGWYYFVQCLDYKCKERGKKLQKVDKWFASSRICHVCGYVNRNLRLTDRSWVCPECGTRHDRDINAAMNIRREGRRMLENNAAPEAGKRFQKKSANQITQQTAYYSSGSHARIKSSYSSDVWTNRSKYSNGLINRITTSNNTSNQKMPSDESADKNIHSDCNSDSTISHCMPYGTQTKQKTQSNDWKTFYQGFRSV